MEAKYVLDSVKIDKEMAEKIKTMVIRVCNPQTSMLSPSMISAGKNKSVKEIVSPHIKNQYILKLDIKQYFESIRYDTVKDVLSQADLPLWFIEKFYFDNNVLRRGLHASSYIAEIIGTKIDNVIKKVLFKNGCSSNVVYTRYCDDILLSSDDMEILRDVEPAITEELHQLGLSLNSTKSKLVHTYTASILGLHINNGEIVVPKRFKKKMRIRVHYADMMYRKCDFNDEENIETALRAVGSAIGSVQYIINNSPDNERINKYKSIHQDLYNSLNELYEARESLLRDENPIKPSEI